VEETSSVDATTSSEGGHRTTSDEDDDDTTSDGDEDGDNMSESENDGEESENQENELKNEENEIEEARTIGCLDYVKTMQWLSCGSSVSKNGDEETSIIRAAAVGCCESDDESADSGTSFCCVFEERTACAMCWGVPIASGMLCTAAALLQGTDCWSVLMGNGSQTQQKLVPESALSSSLSQHPTAAARMMLVSSSPFLETLLPQLNHCMVFT
jgi:hypothetical protein